MRTQPRYCPFLKRLAHESRYSLTGYCTRPSTCELRVPSLAELQQFCTTKDYRHCPFYRFGLEVTSGAGEPYAE
jgi:hypothetical protein